MTTSIYNDLQAIGATIEHHESDLYTPVTADAARIIAKHRIRFVVFISGGSLWYDLPFMFDPYWTARRSNAA